jgi:hypothetical protein
MLISPPGAAEFGSGPAAPRQWPRGLQSTPSWQSAQSAAELDTGNLTVPMRHERRLVQPQPIADCLHIGR